jgi:hypothetical protein
VKVCGKVSAKKVKIEARTRARNSHYARAAFPNAGIPHNPIGSFGIGFSATKHGDDVCPVFVTSEKYLFC